MVGILHGAALLFYGAAGVLLGANFAGGRGAPPKGVAWIVVLAVLVHGAALAVYTTAFGELPLVGLAPSLSLLTLLIATSLLLATATSDARPVGIVLLPVILLLLGAALLIGIRPAGEALAFRGVWFSFHVVLALVGFAGFAVAFAAGLLYLLQFRELKSKHFGRVFRFVPPLHTLDALGRGAAVSGFLALTLALILGWAWTIRFQNTLAMDTVKVAWATLTWLIFAAVLGARLGGPGSSRRAALVSVVGFVLVVVAYVVLRLGTVAGSSMFL